MPFTREYIRKIAKECGIENLPREMEDGLINEHISARDAYATTQVETALKDHKVNVKESEEYKTLDKEFKDYKDSVANEKAAAGKDKAVRAYLESKGFKGKNLEVALRAAKAEVEGLKMDGEKIKDTKALDDLIAGDLSVLATETHGADTGNPPAGGGGDGGQDLGKLPMEDYIAARNKK